MVKLDKLTRKWAREILELLGTGPKSFNELMVALSSHKPKISTPSLSDRLKDFEEEGLIHRDPVDRRPPRTPYTITTEGNKVLSYIKGIEEV